MKTKGFPLILVIILLGMITLGCNTTVENKELTEEEMEAILSEVTGGEEILMAAAQRYFDGLNSENRNLISPQDLDKLVKDSGESIYILDIRQAEDFAKGHIEGAHNVWWFDVGQHLDQLPKDKQIIVTCYTGQSAGQVIGVLRTVGFNAISLLGGMNNGWYQSDLPVVQ